MSLPMPRSYAEVARNLDGRPSEENTPGTLAFSVNRKNSGTSNEVAHRGSIGFEEFIPDPSRDLSRPRNASPQPSFRRPSIAQVLGRRFSRSSQASGSTPDPSSSFNLAAVQEPGPRTAAEDHQKHETMGIFMRFMPSPTPRSPPMLLMKRLSRWLLRTAMLNA
jgi:hypothetical protein